MNTGGDAGHGVVGLGDSFMNGYGLPLGGVSCTSWGGWLAWALTTCFTCLAANGATCEQVLRDQVPLLRGSYRLGVVSVGANDIARLDPPHFESRLSAVTAAVSSHCRVTAIATLPAALTSAAASQGTHAAGRLAANACIRAVASSTGAVLVELEEALDAAWAMGPGQRHPTAFGQLTVARVAATALDKAGLRFARHLPPVAPLQPTLDEQRLYWPVRRSRLRLSLGLARATRNRGDA